MSYSYGASVIRSEEEAASGRFSAKLQNMEEGGDFANHIRTTPFDAARHPIIHFDYKVSEGENNVTWDGKDDFGSRVPDGLYTFTLKVEGFAGAGAIEKAGIITLDTTPPSLTE